MGIRLGTLRRRRPGHRGLTCTSSPKSPQREAITTAKHGSVDVTSSAVSPTLSGTDGWPVRPEALPHHARRGKAARKLCGGDDVAKRWQAGAPAGSPPCGTSPAPVAGRLLIAMAGFGSGDGSRRDGVSSASTGVAAKIGNLGIG